MNCYLSHTVGSKAELLALYSIVLPKLLEKQSPSTEAKTEGKNGDSQKMTAGKKRLENVKIVSKEKM